MPPQNSRIRGFGKSIFEAGGEPIGHRVADDHYRVRSRGVRLLQRARSVGVILLPLPRDRRWRRAEQIAEQVKRLRRALLWLRSSRIPPISPSAPELSVGRQVRDETEAKGRRNCDRDRNSKSSPLICLHARNARRFGFAVAETWVAAARSRPLRGQCRGSI